MQYAVNDVSDAVLPGSRLGIHVSEMKARKRLRARQNAFANVFERLPLGLADADDMSELPHDIESAIKCGCAE